MIPPGRGVGKRREFHYFALEDQELRDSSSLQRASSKEERVGHRTVEMPFPQGKQLSVGMSSRIVGI
jgi:hypothetical protein